MAPCGRSNLGSVQFSSRFCQSARQRRRVGPRFRRPWREKRSAASGTTTWSVAIRAERLIAPRLGPTSTSTMVASIGHPDDLQKAVITRNAQVLAGSSDEVVLPAPRQVITRNGAPARGSVSGSTQVQSSASSVREVVLEARERQVARQQVHEAWYTSDACRWSSLAPPDVADFRERLDEAVYGRWEQGSAREQSSIPAARLPGSRLHRGTPPSDSPAGPGPRPAPRARSRTTSMQCVDTRGRSCRRHSCC